MCPTNHSIAHSTQMLPCCDVNLDSPDRRQGKLHCTRSHLTHYRSRNTIARHDDNVGLVVVKRLTLNYFIKLIRKSFRTNKRPKKQHSANIPFRHIDVYHTAPCHGHAVPIPIPYHTVPYIPPAKHFTSLARPPCHHFTTRCDTHGLHGEIRHHPRTWMRTETCH